MTEWRKVKLGELYEVHNGLSKGRQFFGSGYPFLSFSTVFNHWFLPEQLDSLVQSTKKERIACSIKRGDVFITRTSETMDELGMSSVALKDYPDATYNGFTKRLRPITDEVLPEFIGYYLRSRKFRAKFMAFSSMTTRASLANNDLLSMEVEVPEKSVQRRIGVVLSRYDALIENYQRQIKLLEEAAQRLYKEWFVDLRFPGHQSTPIINNLPQFWQKKKLAEIFTFVRGKSYTSKELSDKGTLMVNLKNIQAFGGYKRDAEKRFTGDYKIEQSLYKGDLIMGVTDMTQERRLVGHVALVPDFNEPATFSMDLIKILPFELPNVFLYCAMRFGGISTIISPLANGVNVLHLKPDAMMNIEMTIPSNDLIMRFTSYATSCIEEINKLENQIRNLSEARDRLLPKLMSGEKEL
ncbi:MAG: restriction endonuclease subunit S [Bacteroidales bacterium]|nr:restriction endonuclease subunit S [Bacteroidales bacterium]